MKSPRKFDNWPSCAGILSIQNKKKVCVQMGNYCHSDISKLKYFHLSIMEDGRPVSWLFASLRLYKPDIWPNSAGIVPIQKQTHVRAVPYRIKQNYGGVKIGDFRPDSWLPPTSSPHRFDNWPSSTGIKPIHSISKTMVGTKIHWPKSVHFTIQLVIRKIEEFQIR